MNKNTLLICAALVGVLIIYKVSKRPKRGNIVAPNPADFEANSFNSVVYDPLGMYGVMN